MLLCSEIQWLKKKWVIIFITALVSLLSTPRPAGRRDLITSVMKECSGIPHGARLFFVLKKWWKEHVDTCVTLFNFSNAVSKVMYSITLFLFFWKKKKKGEWCNLKQQQFWRELTQKDFSPGESEEEEEGFKDSRWTARAQRQDYLLKGKTVDT